jgi:hypothetical protein
MKKKVLKKKNNKSAAGKTPVKVKSTIRKSKSDEFLKNLHSNSMVDYFTELRIMNPAAQLTRNLNEPRREGGFVRLAHAREEFTAPILSKGKSVSSALKNSKRSNKKPVR